MEDKEMNTYDTVIIFKPDIEGEGFDSAIDYYKQVLKTFPSIRIKTEKIGKKSLAYDITGHKEGLFAIFHFKTEAENIKELERRFRIDDNVLKFITVKLSEEDAEFNYEPDEDESEQPDEKIKKPVDVFDLIYGIE